MTAVNTPDVDAVRGCCPAAGAAPPVPDITFSWEWVTPAVAASYLSCEHTSNRRRRRAWVLVLAEAMRDGQFVPTHQGICFDVHNHLIDGAHRLSAVVHSGVSVWLPVARGVSSGALAAVDGGRARDDADRLNMNSDLDLGRNHIAVARSMFMGVRSYSGTSVPAGYIGGYKLLDFLNEHWPALCFARPSSGVKGYPSVVKGMVAKAWYHVDRGRLTDFVNIMTGSDPSSAADGAALRLRDFLRDGRNFSTSSALRPSIARKCQAAIRAFCDHRSLKMLQEVGEDLYPLPARKEGP